MRHAVVSSGVVCLGVVCTTLSLSSCNEHPLKPVELEILGEARQDVEIFANRDVDILFVIDNSGSMGEEQGTLASNFDEFISVLEDPEVDANYRIGITTTDNGNPWCSGTSPEGGALRLTSCKERLGEFIFEGSTPVTNRQDEACNDVCVHDSIEVLPSMTEADGERKQRPWFERLDGETNLPDGVTTTEAFQCFGPQGINGCGFESHLESMYKALNRSQNHNESSFGFMRDNAILAVIYVTDEADCSYQVDHDEIFLAPPDGNQAFWSDTDEQFPTSAVCWNAGVSCTGSGGIYDECVAENYDVDGNPTAETDAVLHPLSRYIGLLQEIEDAKQVNNPKQEVVVGVISGVPEGYGDGSKIQYQDAISDPEFQKDFGIGPGCSAVDAEGNTIGKAVPPVRMKEFAEAFEIEDKRNLFSVCASDYSPALRAIGDLIASQVTPPCMPRCVADSNPATPALEPQCTVTQTVPIADGTSTENLQECNADGSLPANATVCFNYLTGDEMSPDCSMEGWNLEFEIIRSGAAEGGTSVTATCQLSQDREQDCPNL